MSDSVLPLRRDERGPGASYLQDTPAWGAAPFFSSGIAPSFYPTNGPLGFDNVASEQPFYYAPSAPPPYMWSHPGYPQTPFPTSRAPGATWSWPEATTLTPPQLFPDASRPREGASLSNLSPEMTHLPTEDESTSPADAMQDMGGEYFTMDGNQSATGIALTDVQMWPDASMEDAFTDESQDEAPFFVTCVSRDPGEAYPTPPETNHEPDARPSTILRNHLAADDAREALGKDRGQHSRSPSEIIHVRQTKTPRPARAGKVSKPRSKVRARPARNPQRSTRDSVTPTGSPTTNTPIAKDQCPHCEQTSKNAAALQKHITLTHTRPFSCVFVRYGCTSTFGSKNEWKRHVASQHLRLGIWRCDLPGCQPEGFASGGGCFDGNEDEDEEQVFNDFNRKDLFMQHLRRMHMPNDLATAGNEREIRAAATEWLATAARRCWLSLRSPPPRAVCGFCNQLFEGDQAWEMRMEHVGRHLESGHADEGTWRDDAGLYHWMIEQKLLERRVVQGEPAWMLPATPATAAAQMATPPSSSSDAAAMPPSRGRGRPTGRAR